MTSAAREFRRRLGHDTGWDLNAQGVDRETAAVTLAQAVRDEGGRAAITLGHHSELPHLLSNTIFIALLTLSLHDVRIIVAP